jgi:hypothetical protein
VVDPFRLGTTYGAVGTNRVVLRKSGNRVTARCCACIANTRGVPLSAGSRTVPCCPSSPTTIGKSGADRSDRTSRMKFSRFRPYSSTNGQDIKSFHPWNQTRPRRRYDEVRLSYPGTYSDRRSSVLSTSSIMAR